jgi:hypothetical protein
VQEGEEMIQEFVDIYQNNKDILRKAFQVKHPEDYAELVKAVVTIISGFSKDYSKPDPDRITTIDHGGYQGTLLFVIGAEGYQPDRYWYVKVNYGSCSGCDTLEAIRDYENGPPNEKQIDDYMTLALHIVQGLKLMGGEVV